MVTKEQLDQALEAWYVARDKAAHEQSAWGLVMESHKALISSLRSNGHSWLQADTEFKKISAGHHKAALAAYEDMDRLCGEYQALAKQFKAQQK